MWARSPFICCDMLHNKLDDREQKTLPSAMPWIESGLLCSVVWSINNHCPLVTIATTWSTWLKHMTSGGLRTADVYIATDFTQHWQQTSNLPAQKIRKGLVGNLCVRFAVLLGARAWICRRMCDWVSHTVRECRLSGEVHAPLCIIRLGSHSNSSEAAGLGTPWPRGISAMCY